MNIVGTIGTMTAHGKSLSPVPGSFNIFVRGRAIWRTSLDFHPCPVSDPKPHIGGMVLLGRNRILVKNFPVAFKGDQIFEATSVNAII